MTPGQAAYEVMWAAAGVDVRWEDLDAGDRQLWDTIAQAVLEARVAEWTHDPLMDIPPGELVHLLGLVDLDSGGEAAYDGYRSASAARSLVSGQPLPQWAGQSEQIRGAWQAAAEGVVALLADKLTEAIAAQPAPGLAATMATLATEMHARADAPVPPDAVDVADRIVRAQVLHEYAARIRQVIERGGLPPLEGK